MNASPSFRFGMKTLLGWAFHCSVIVATLSFAARNSSIDLQPWLRDLQETVLSRGGFGTFLLVMGAGLGPLVMLGFLIWLAAMQVSPRYRMVSSCYYLAFVVGLIAVPSFVEMSREGEWEWLARMGIILGVTTIAGWIEAIARERARKPTRETQEFIDGGNVPVMLQQRHVFPELLISPMIMSAGTFVVWSILIAFEEMLSV